MEIELLIPCVWERSRKKSDLVHLTRPKILGYLLEPRTQELQTIIEGELLPQGEVQVLLH